MNFLKFILVFGFAVSVVSCNSGKVVMGPEEVAVAFGRAVASGDLDAARELCDSLSMNSYLENCGLRMDAMQKEDSSVFAVASALLAGAEFEVTGTRKEGEDRLVTYRISFGKNEKTKVATLRKEEGEWRVRAITDAI